MKNLFFIGLLASSLIQAQNADSSLVAYYPFDGNTNDYGIYGNDGVALGNPFYVPGISGQAIFLNGISDYVLVAGTPSLHDLTSEYTFAGWVKPLGTPNFYVTICTKGNTTDMRTPLAVIYRSPETTPYIRTAGEGLPFSLVNIDTVTNACPMNEWSFFTWTFKDGLVSIYKDAALIASYQFPFSQLASNQLPMEIGRDVPGFSTEFMYGLLDEMCILNRALSIKEIDYLYRQKLISGTSIESNPGEGTFQIYPNPANEEVEIDFSGIGKEAVLFELINGTGQLIQRISSTSDESGLHHEKMDTRPLPSGNYCVAVYFKGKVQTRSFLINH